MCYGQTFSTCDENIARRSKGSENWAGFSSLTQLKDRSFEKEMAALLPRKFNSACQTAALPKNVLFPLKLN